jgi:hypothetical protein
VDSTASVADNSISVSSGMSSGAISLNAGDNTLSVVVSAEDNTTIQTYTINVIRPYTASALKQMMDFQLNGIIEIDDIVHILSKSQTELLAYDFNLGGKFDRMDIQYMLTLIDPKYQI